MHNLKGILYEACRIDTI